MGDNQVKRASAFKLEAHTGFTKSTVRAWGHRAPKNDQVLVGANLKFELPFKGTSASSVLGGFVDVFVPTKDGQTAFAGGPSFGCLLKFTKNVSMGLNIRAGAIKLNKRGDKQSLLGLYISPLFGLNVRVTKVLGFGVFFGGYAAFLKGNSAVHLARGLHSYNMWGYLGGGNISLSFDIAPKQKN